MKKLIFIVFIVVSVFACKNREREDPAIPSWIKPRLEELENTGDCVGSTLQRSTYSGMNYYDLYSNKSSCVYCEVYDYNGNLVEWSEDFPLSDWLENRTKLIILWECGDEIY